MDVVQVARGVVAGDPFLHLTFEATEVFFVLLGHMVRVGIVELVKIGVQGVWIIPTGWKYPGRWVRDTLEDVSRIEPLERKDSVDCMTEEQVFLFETTR